MATQYIHFTEEQKQTARQTDIAELLRRQGQTLKRSGSEYEWKDGSAKVTVRGNLWFHQYDHEGGDAIDFVRRFMGKSYPEAVEFLLSGCGGSLTLSPPIQRQQINRGSHFAHASERHTPAGCRPDCPCKRSGNRFVTHIQFFCQLLLRQSKSFS